MHKISPDVLKLINIILIDFLRNYFVSEVLFNMATKIFISSNKFRNTIRILQRFVPNQNYSKACSLSPELEIAFNNQINAEFFASFTYLSMAVYFGRQNVALPGCHKYFLDQVQDEREHAQKLIDYLLRRGNSVSLQPIQAPPIQEWNSPLEAFQDALKLEKSVSQKLFDLRKTSEQMGDLCACLLIENEFLETQIEESDRLSRHVAELEKIGPNGLGIYLFDRYLLKESK